MPQPGNTNEPRSIDCGNDGGSNGGRDDSLDDTIIVRGTRTNRGVNTAIFRGSNHRIRIRFRAGGRNGGSGGSGNGPAGEGDGNELLPPCSAWLGYGNDLVTTGNVINNLSIATAMGGGATALAGRITGNPHAIKYGGLAFATGALGTQVGSVTVFAGGIVQGANGGGFQNAKTRLLSLGLSGIGRTAIGVTKQLNPVVRADPLGAESVVALAEGAGTFLGAANTALNQPGAVECRN